MKKIKFVASISLNAVSIISLLMTAAILLGCGVPTDPTQLDLAIADARDIATLGTQAALAENPKFRKELELTRDALAAVATLPPGKATIDDLTKALALLPIKELQSEKGQIYVAGGRIVLRRFTSLITKPDFDIGASGAVQKFAAALRDGMNERLL